ncbi:hypothetical protein BN2476_640044 [Paraburkholderia piptadeniae]|uniref:Uncharacterized protein n=1 Tax=Paraburkholderia piptadeniae TaxID=1701573 RepID=A0A1N7SM61_9BURK|nr:hypothetical protein BN2476_640044 [Paraburkholderia piptadeniae]
MHALRREQKSHSATTHASTSFGARARRSCTDASGRVAIGESVGKQLRTGVAGPIGGKIAVSFRPSSL